MHKVTIHEAKTHLSKLIQECLAGEEVVIAKGKEPVVRLVPIKRRKQKRRLGGAKGLVTHMAEDFDDPLDDFKSRLSQYMSLVEEGEEVEICSRNVPFARVIPPSKTKENQTQLGCDQVSVQVNADLTEPAIPEHDWEMLEGDA